MREIIDFHTHPFLDENDSICIYKRTTKTLPDDLSLIGIDRFCGSVITYRSSGIGNTRISNDTALALRKKYGNKYIPGFMVHPNFPEESIEELKKAKANGIRLIGELVHYPMGWTGHDRRELIEILRVASDRKMTLSFHPSRNTAAMETLISSLPDMNIVIAHLDGYGLYDWSVEMMKKYRNVYFDISAHGAERVGMLSDTVNAVGAERILYGTDFPGYSSEKFINYVLSERISDSDREAIFYKHAERLLRLG